MTDADQHETEYMPVTVPVKHRGSIVNRELPSHTSIDNRYVGAIAEKILSRDPTRKGALLISLDQDIFIGETVGDVQNLQTTGAGASKWPALTPLPIYGNNEIYIASASSSDSTNVTILIDRWQDSEDET